MEHPIILKTLFLQNSIDFEIEEVINILKRGRLKINLLYVFGLIHTYTNKDETDEE